MPPDQEKSKAELIAELAAAKRSLARYEAMVADLSSPDITERKRMETDLRAGEERYRLLAENVQDIVWVVDPQLNYTYISPSVKKILGYDPEKIIGKPLRNGISEPFLAAVDRAIEARLGDERGGKGKTEEEIWRLQYAHRDGTLVWVESLITPLREPDGRFMGMIGCTRDITRQVEMAEALKESERRYRSVVEDQTEVISRFRADGTFLFVNEVYCKFFGKTAGELIGKKWHPVAVPEDLPEIEKKLALLSPETPVVVVENRVYSGTGDVRWMQFVNRAFHDEAGRLTEIQSVGRDITDRKHAEQAVEESQERLQLVLEGSRTGFWDWDIRTGEVRRNEHWAMMLGYGPEEIRFTVDQWLDFIHPEDRDLAWQSIRDHLAGRSDMHKVEYRMVTKDGGFKWILDQARVVRRDLDGAPLRMSGTHTDITERKRAEADRIRLERHLQASQRLESLGIMAGGIAHDFNNILMIVLGNLEMARDETEDPRLQSRLEASEKAAQRAVEIVRQILAYSGKGHVAAHPLDLGRLIRNISELLRFAIPKWICLNLHPSPVLPKVIGDEAQLQQVVTNLVLNAAESYGEGNDGFVAVSTGVETCTGGTLSETVPDVWMSYPQPLPEGRFVFVDVRDEGAGMDPEIRKRIFEPFYTTKFQGRGLGLAAVLGIVRGHKGYIRVDSGPDTGTAVRVLFPAVGEGAAGGTEAVPATGSGRRGASGRALLVGDEAQIRELVRRMFERLGYTVLFASDGADALDLFRDKGRPVDLVLFDLTMDGRGCVEILQAIRRWDPKVPVILSSGYSEEEIRSRHGDMEYSGFLQKPYGSADLERVLKRGDL